MDYFIGGRRSGKTQRMVEWVREGVETDEYPFWSRVIVTPNEREAMQLRQSFELDYRQVFAIGDWKNRNVRFGEKIEVGMDNADLVLQEFIGSKLAFVTMTS